MTLDELKPGQKCHIAKVNAEGVTGQRLLDMGFVPGAKIHIIRNAPLVDPVEILLKGYHISIRHSESKEIEIVVP
ncbi:MAG: ferrous iron transport protein A [Candidatus Omnitrophica bacterium]|nr:ferrous iron transport protein A [Candidatus Omnitrophota bacterium]